MTTLQEATYYAVLIYCSLAILSLLFLSLTGLVMIRKIVKAKHKIDEKINLLTGLPYISKHILKAVKENLK